MNKQTLREIGLISLFISILLLAALAQSLHQIAHGLLGRDALDDAASDEVLHGLAGQRLHRPGLFQALRQHDDLVADGDVRPAGLATREQ